MKRIRRGVLLVLALAVGCSDSPTPAGETNVIDEALRPRLQAAGAEPLPFAGDRELCRRMFIDVLGAAPTIAEVREICIGNDASGIADALLSSPRAIALEQRLWAGHMRFDYNLIRGEHLVDADVVIEALATGEIGYDDFAARILAHPAFAGNQNYPTYDSWGNEERFVTDVSRNAIRVFLGRVPIGVEAADFGNLFRSWRFYYGGDPPYVSVDEVKFAMLDPQACAESVLGRAACTSSALGETATVVLADVLAEVTPYLRFAGEVPEPVQRELEKPGRLLSKRPEFWDEAADHALARFLGWWKASYAQPDSDLPEVRAALATWFRATPNRDIRELHRMILTSTLYATTAEVDPILPELADWQSGPTKPMTAEVYLDSIAATSGLELGFCDFHTDEEPYLDRADSFYPPYLREPDPIDILEIEGEPFPYYDTGWYLGGCRGPAARTGYHPGMKSLTTQIEIAPEICWAAAARGVLVPDQVAGAELSDVTARALATALFDRFLSRTPSAEELDVIGEQATACAGDDCALDSFAVELCAGILRSSAFLYY